MYLARCKKCFKDDSTVFQDCFKEFLRKFEGGEGCFSMFQRSFRGAKIISRVFKWYFKQVLRGFEGNVNPLSPGVLDPDNYPQLYFGFFELFYAP